MHISLDGFVADKNGDLECFENGNEHLSFVNQLLQTADCIMLGRITYEMFNSYWPGIASDPNASIDEINYSKWYNSVTKIILSNSLKGLEEERKAVINDDCISSIKKLKELGSKDILLFGSPTVGQLLLQENLIDGYWLFVNPVVLGTGTPMFIEKTNLMRLKLIKTQKISNGEVALHYEVKN